jgi:FAD:protein FMN transferase
MRVEYQRSCEAMGTRFDVTLRGADEQHLEALAVAVCEEIQRLDAVLSRFNPSSEIARINREATSKAVRVDRARQATDGYFDVTAASGSNGYELEAKRCTVQFTRPDAMIDLGAIGKGFALDCAREILTRFGVDSVLLNGGTSSVLAIGGPFAVDVRHPLMPEVIVQRLELTNRALSCSAVRHPTQAQSDITNPLTGMPLTGDAACVVLAASATEAEIVSTALLAMGREIADRFLEKMTYADLQVEWV